LYFSLRKDAHPSPPRPPSTNMRASSINMGIPRFPVFERGSEET
jgi:hypothetical protein